MTIPRVAYAVPEDPLIAVFHLNQPITADTLRMAINYRETIIDIHRQEVEILQTALKRFMGTAPASPALQESARTVGGGDRA